MNTSTAIITGAGSGIGRATALAFLSIGWNVVLIGRRREPLDEIARQHPTGRVRPAPCDLLKPDDVRTMVAELTSLVESGSLSIKALINNAGIYERAPFIDCTDEIWERQLTSNLIAPARLSRQIVPLIAASGGGTIVNISSTLGLRPAPTTAAYSAAKAGLINLTMTMARELADLKIRVNCVCPGIVDTPIHAFHGIDTPEAKATVAALDKLQPAGRIGRPEEVAAGVLYFCQPLSEWTTGAVLNIDGGINLM